MFPLSGSNGCADRLTNWDGTKNLGLAAPEKKKMAKALGIRKIFRKDWKLQHNSATLRLKALSASYIIHISARKMEKKHEISVINALNMVWKHPQGISHQDNLLHLCWNLDSVHNWNGILSIGSLLKIAKTKRTKIKTTDALPCLSICLSHQLVAASYSGRCERSIFLFFLFEAFDDAWVMGTDDTDAAPFLFYI